ncbi:hypothetical protein TNCV_3439641 [Trichonephila clavipes]|nr:hypothetical protein TNCV_3439641 [Trichonephila clavipes]
MEFSMLHCGTPLKEFDSRDDACRRLFNRKPQSERRSKADNAENIETVIVKSSEQRVMNHSRLEIETFYEFGKRLDFQNHFETTVHDNGDLRKTENLYT